MFSSKAKNQIIQFLLSSIDKIVKRKHERIDQHHATSICESNENLPPGFLQQQEVQQNQAPIKQHTIQPSKSPMVG